MINLKKFPSRLTKNVVRSRDVSTHACENSFLHSPYAIALVGVGLVTILSLTFSGDAFAMTEDSMKTGLTNLENTLTGSWMRVGLIVGGLIGTITSFIKQSPMGIVASAGTGLGAVFFTDWAKAAFTALI